MSSGDSFNREGSSNLPLIHVHVGIASGMARRSVIIGLLESTVRESFIDSNIDVATIIPRS